VVFSALDEGGHKRSCTTMLTVRDVTPPEVACGDFDGSVPAVLQARVEDACGATAVVKSMVCTLTDEGGDSVLETCPVTTRGDTVEIARYPADGTLRVSYQIEALDASSNASSVECTLVVVRDRDQDGVIDDEDICLTVADPAQRDTDLDGVGDACDVCPALADPDQRDGNGDGIGDACAADDGLSAQGGGGCGGGGTSVLLLSLVALGLMARRRRRPPDRVGAGAGNDHHDGRGG
jgi:hypothetical protein